MLSQKQKEITSKIIMYIIVTIIFFVSFSIVWVLANTFILSGYSYDHIDTGLLLVCSYLAADARLTKFENSKLKTLNEALMGLRNSYNKLLAEIVKNKIIATRSSCSSSPNEDGRKE